MITDSTLLALADDVTFQALGDGQETVILSLRSGYLYTCNETTDRFLTSLDGQRTFGQVIDALLKEFDVPREKLSDDMASLVQKLMKEKLIVERPPRQATKYD